MNDRVFFQSGRAIAIYRVGKRRSRLGVWKNPNSMKPSEFRKRAREK